MKNGWRRTLAGALATGLAAATAATATAATVGTTFPAGFPVIQDASLGVPVLGFGAAGPVHRTPVILLHGNNDTAYPPRATPTGRCTPWRSTWPTTATRRASSGASATRATSATRSPTRPSSRPARPLDASPTSPTSTVRPRGARLHRREARRRRRPQPRRDADAGVDEAGAHRPSRAPARRDRRPEPRDRRLLAVTGELLPAARLRRLHARRARSARSTARPTRRSSAG